MSKLTISLEIEKKDNKNFEHDPESCYYSVSNSVEMSGFGTKEDIYRAFHAFMVSLGYHAPELEKLLDFEFGEEMP